MLAYSIISFMNSFNSSSEFFPSISALYSFDKSDKVCLSGSKNPFITAMLAAATGFNYTTEEVMRAGDRVWNLEKLWNIKIGMTKKDDYLPPRFMNEPMPEGAAKGQIVHIEELLSDYYKVRGWSNEGIPTENKLKELGL
jgi:aldehyde:ferredoxin oxidoreductase